MRHKVAHFFCFIIFVAKMEKMFNKNCFIMKKFTLTILALLAIAFTGTAQQYVSTVPANRNVILEEFTGRNCGYCPDGHLIANGIMANYPGRVWAINVHAGGYAPTTYPNFITADGNTIHGGFSISGYPTGVVNRSTAAGQGRGAWSNLSTVQLGQAAECNVAGRVAINPESRIASITVEVYYTGNSGYDQNYLTVAMLQDSIMGSQSGMSGNPAQVVNGTYCHMHVLRDIITESAWGEAISPTTQGTLITKTYEYQIPEVIGSPNGVDVILDHIFFLAWVSERFQGTPARPILNACELQKTIMTNEPIYPSVGAVTQTVSANCSLEQTFGFSLTNIGTETLTSVQFHAQVEGATREFEWTGELAPGDNTKMEFMSEVPFGIHTGVLNITEVNGQPYEKTTTFAAESMEWAETSVEGPTTNIKVFIVQDQWGEQITWNIVNSAGEIVAEGGPYSHLAGSGSTQINLETVNDLPSNDCYLFRIYDSNNNGICCNYGNGYYYIKDAHGNRFIEGDGDFGSEDRKLFSINNTTEIASDDQESLKVYPNPANDYLMVEGEMTSIEIYDAMGQRLLVKETKDANLRINISEYSNGIYFLRVNNNGETAVRKFSVNR